MSYREDAIELMKLNISDAQKAIEAEDYVSAADSLGKAEFWARRVATN